MAVSNELKVGKTVSATDTDSLPDAETVLWVPRSQNSRSPLTFSGRHFEVSGWPRGAAEAAPYGIIRQREASRRITGVL